MTWFYALWVYHKGDGWTIWWVPCKDKIVRLVRLFRRHHDIGLPMSPDCPCHPLRVPLMPSCSTGCGPDPSFL